MHDRYWSHFKQRGTAPRGSTVRRLRFQEAAGMPVVCRLTVRHGMLMHPTRGWRMLAGTPWSKREGVATRLRAMVRHLVELRPDRRLNAPHALQPASRMTNWQRTQWARAGYPKDRVDEFLALERRPS